MPQTRRVFTAMVLSAVVFCVGAAEVRAMSDVCPDVCFPREDYGLFDCQTEYDDLCDVVLMQGMEFVVRNARKKFAAPVLEEGAAKAPGDGVVEFSAKLKKVKKRKKKVERELSVYFSVDNRKSWHVKKMKYDPLREEWVAKADVGEGASRAHYFFRAVDTEGNTYIEAPCSVREFPPKSDCLAPLSPDQSYEDYEDFHIEPYLDILDSHVGVNSDSIYFAIRAHGGIDPGTALPERKNYFFVAVMNPDRWNDREPYENTSILIYAPMHFLPRECAMFKRYGDEWAYDATILNCSARGDRLFFSAPLGQAPGGNPTGYFTVVLGSGQLIGGDSGIIKDYTMLTSVRPVVRVLEIE